jgi:hypothetical protein
MRVPLYKMDGQETGREMGAGLVTAFFGAVFLVGVFAIVSAPFLMYFSGALTFIQALRISAVSFAVMMSLMFAFYAIKPVGTGAGVEGIVSVLSLSLAGALITELAARNGIKKTGLLGVGAKAVLSLLAMSWVLVGVLYVVVGL